MDVKSKKVSGEVRPYCYCCGSENRPAASLDDRFIVTGPFAEPSDDELCGNEIDPGSALEDSCGGREVTLVSDWVRFYDGSGTAIADRT